MSSAGITCACTFPDTAYVSTSCGASYVLFMGLVESVLRSNCDVSEACQRLGSADLRSRDAEFDFVVVGAGAAGPVVAGRLSENPQWEVLLMEAGPEEPTLSQVPAFAMSAVGTQLDWQYKTVPQQNACLNNGGVCSWPRGRMVGGSNSMNGMMYTRGSPAIFDSWAKLGNYGWSYQEVLPYFIKSESNGNPELVDAGFHGFSGPVTVQQFPYRPALADAVVAAAEEMGYRRADLNGRNMTGANVAQMMQKDGLRQNTERAYLRPNRNRRNLELLTNAQATRVLIDPTSSRAYGVEYLDQNGTKKVVKARKEVILSAGTVGSPQLLLLSGVGPTEDLQQVGIRVIQNLPVGRNLRNHVSTGITFSIDEQGTTSLDSESLNTYMNSHTGPLASTGLTQTTAFLLSKFATDGVPDLQVFFDGYAARCSRTGVVNECTNGEVSTDCGKRSISARPTNVRPDSVGFLKLNTSDPLDYPIIDPKYLTVQKDIDVLVDGIKQLIQFTQTEALKPYNFTLNTTPASGCENIEFGTDEYWACMIRRTTGPENHQVGSCRMGPIGDPEAVVDPQLRVQGITGLRVIDASVFAWTPNSNTVAATIMAGEKGADMIKQAWSGANNAGNNNQQSQLNPQNPQNQTPQQKPSHSQRPQTQQPKPTWPKPSQNTHYRPSQVTQPTYSRQPAYSQKPKQTWPNQPQSTQYRSPQVTQQWQQSAYSQQPTSTRPFYG